MKKVILFLACLTAILFCLPATAEDSFQEGVFTYTVSGQNATITNVNDGQSLVVVPETLAGYTVTTLGDGAFGGSTLIKEVVLPDTVTTIGDFCFAYSNSLVKITFGKNLTTIADGAFYHCEKLWTVTLPDSVKTIGKNAFGRCTALTALTAPNSIDFIGDAAFPTTAHFCLYSAVDSVAHNYAKENTIAFEEYITVTLNGEVIRFDQPCITNTEHYRTLVPMRAVLEKLGAEITWDNTFNTAGITVLDTRLLIRPNEPFMMVNGTAHYLSCPAVEFNGRVMVPIRDIMEAIGGTVSWSEKNKTVTLTCKNNTTN